MDEVIETEYQKNLRDTLKRSVAEMYHPQGESLRAQEEEYEEEHVDYEPSPVHEMLIETHAVVVTEEDIEVSYGMIADSLKHI